MNRKTLIGLIVAAAIAIIAAVAVQHSNAPRGAGGEGEMYFAPELRDHVNDITQVVVTGAGSKTLATLKRGANGWTLDERGGYAVDSGKLRAFLLKLSDAKEIERKTSKPANYAALGLEDMSAKDAVGLQVEFDGLAKPDKLIVGNANPRSGGTFVRRAGDAQSWLVSGTLTLGKNAADWLRKDLVDIAANRIQSVTITRPDGKIVRIAKGAEGDANFKLADVPKGREPGPDYIVNTPASMLAGLHLDDVLPAKDTAPPDRPLKARYATFDGVVVDITAWEKDGKDYAQFAASLDAAQADRSITAAQAKAKAAYDAADAAPDDKAGGAKTADAAKEGNAPAKPLAVSDPARDRENRLVDLKKTVADLNARLDGWTYVLPAYTYATVNKSQEDLLKPLAQKKPETGKKKPVEQKS